MSGKFQKCRCGSVEQLDGTEGRRYADQHLIVESRWDSQYSPGGGYGELVCPKIGWRFFERWGPDESDYSLHRRPYTQPTDYLDPTLVRRRAEAVAIAHRDLRAGGPDAARELSLACAALYSPDMNNLVAAIPSGDHDAIEAGLVFLEVDPWCFRSGYLKQRIATKLIQVELDAATRSRLVPVLLHAVDAGSRMEFRSYCRLARRLPAHLLRSALADRLTAPGVGTRRRAVRMLGVLVHPRLSDAELRAARAVVIEIAARPQEWDYTLRNLYRRFWSPEWQAELLALAAFDRTKRIPVLNAIATRRRTRLSIEERSPILVAAVTDTEDPSWSRWMDYALRHHEAAELRAAVEPLSASSDAAVAAQARAALVELDRIARERTGP